ncbi:hypothetical protein VA608_05090 [Pasteurella multocida]|uniref:hypothetical protein n=1 Tax=Pasteurella multocida TaxID=747 RepID=UPI002D764ED4|nr:hypothetical protein [Pasteurella multocida]WRU39389.1 hypothetical protein VA608_05090 [Pasteurella multocida]
MNEELDYSKLNVAELKAISIAYENMIHHTDNSPYPYFSATMGALGEQFIDYPAEHIRELKFFYDELTTICRHLLDLSPVPPSLDPDELVNSATNDELINGMLKTGLIHTLVSDLQAIQKVIEIRLAMIECGSNTGAYHEIH